MQVTQRCVLILFTLKVKLTCFVLWQFDDCSFKGQDASVFSVYDYNQTTNMITLHTIQAIHGEYCACILL